MRAAPGNSRKRSPRGGRELTKLHRILAVRERQLAACVAALKGVVQFKSAHQSVFVTEVEIVQKMAAAGLVRAHEIQAGKRVRGAKRSAVQQWTPTPAVRAKLLLNDIFGPFGVKGTDDE
jgi:hypothetical protein